jgi:molybdopterin converting factor small subunit
MVTVRIPSAMRTLTGGASSVAVDGATVREALDGVVAAHPQLGARLFEGDGTIRRFVNVYVDGDDVRHAEGLETKLSPGQILSVLPAVAGGRS